MQAISLIQRPYGRGVSNNISMILIALCCCTTLLTYATAMSSSSTKYIRGLQSASTATKFSCGCNDCNTATLQRDAGGHSCGARIEWLQQHKQKMELEACHQVAVQEFPNECGTCHPDTYQRPHLYCGDCPECTETVWKNTLAGDYACGARIEWLQSHRNMDQLSACTRIGGIEFPQECAMCNPESCHATGQQEQQTSTKLCGGAVNSSPTNATAQTSTGTCWTDLWEPTYHAANTKTSPCFAYGGRGDPCHLSNTNDQNDGLDKDPLDCQSGDTFFLWDEPDTQGKDYAWAGIAWKEYATRRFPHELLALRQERGVLVTTPLLRVGAKGVLAKHVKEFFNACGPSCRDPTSPAYMDVVAINAFCGDWNGENGCRGGAQWIAREVTEMMVAMSLEGLPVYLTNWAKLGGHTAMEQVEAMHAVEVFLEPSSVIQRVYWFGATDYGSSGTIRNALTDVLEVEGGHDHGDESTMMRLGDVWKETCDQILL